MTHNHTPTPWKLKLSLAVIEVVKGGFLIAKIRKLAHCWDEQQANAEFIVRACNAHDDLVAAADEGCAALLGAIAAFPELKNMANVQHAIDLLQAALTKEKECL